MAGARVCLGDTRDEGLHAGSSCLGDPSPTSAPGVLSLLVALPNNYIRPGRAGEPTPAIKQPGGSGPGEAWLTGRREMEHGVEVGGESGLLCMGAHVCAGRALMSTGC